MRPGGGNCPEPFLLDSCNDDKAALTAVVDEDVGDSIARAVIWSVAGTGHVN